MLYFYCMEGQPRSGGASWGPPAEATRPGGRRPTTTQNHHHHQQQQQQVKVKHIVTREVSTDQANFKDVVQWLTGKDSAAARAAVVAAGADGTSSSWSAGGAAVVARGATSTATGVASGSVVVFQDNVAGAGAGATTVFPADEEADMKRWW